MHPSIIKRLAFLSLKLDDQIRKYLSTHFICLFFWLILIVLEVMTQKKTNKKTNLPVCILTGGRAVGVSTTNSSSVVCTWTPRSFFLVLLPPLPPFCLLLFLACGLQTARYYAYIYIVVSRESSIVFSLLRRRWSSFVDVNKEEGCC